MRVYLPGTLTTLTDLQAQRGLDAGPHEGYAVTRRLREWYVGGDLEELEYTAMSQAAEASLHRLAADPNVARRRVVIAVDTPDAAVVAEPEGARSRVRVSGPIPMSAVAAVHADENAAAPAVAAAIEALPAAAAGDEDARFTVEEAAGYDLLWYASQEISDLLA